MDIAKRLCGDFNGRYKDATPAEVAGYTILAVLCAQQAWRAATTPLADHVEAFQEVFFRNLRKYFGDRLGMSAALVEAQTGFLKEFAEQEESLPADTQSRTQLTRLPENGVPRAELLRTIESLATINRDFSKGQFSGSIYHGGDHGYTDFINAAMAAHQWSNPLHAGQFGGVRKMEAEIIQMCVSMFNGPKGACGAITSGGTESILLAMKAYREYAYEKRGVQRGQGEIVAPVTVHAAFDKAAHYFGLKLRHARVDPVTYKVDVAHFRSLITKNTVVLVGSAPHYPHGIVDPIEEIAALGRKWDLPVHVDCCLGGFILPFMEKAGLPIDERFDFRVEGVTSISVDSHKYGFAPKGSSCILWRSASLRTHQMHSQPNWPGGIYASPTIAGSRMGNVVAGTYAAMVSHGMDGYVESCREIVTASRFMAAEFAKIPGVKVLGKPLGSVVAFGSDDFDIYRLLGEMSARGYELSALQYPSALHVCVTRVHAMDDMKNAKLLVADVRSVAEELMRTKDQKATGGVALYGTSQLIPDRSIVGDVAKTYFDAYYTVDCEVCSHTHTHTHPYPSTEEPGGTAEPVNCYTLAKLTERKVRTLVHTREDAHPVICKDDACSTLLFRGEP